MKDKPVFSRLIRYIRPYWISALLTFILLTIAVSGELVTPVLMGKIIDSIKVETIPQNEIALNTEESRTIDNKDITLQEAESLTPEDKENSLHLTKIKKLKKDSSFLLIIILISFIGMTLQIYITGMMGQNVMRDMRLEALTHTQKLSLHYLNNTPKGSIVSRITNDIETINEFVNVLSNQIIKNIEMMIISVVLMMLLNWRLGLVTLITFLPIVFLTEFFRRAARSAYRQVRKRTSGVNAFLSEHISAIPIVKIFNKEEWSKKEFKKKNDGLMQALLKEIKVFSIFRPLTNMFGSISIAIIIQMSGFLRIVNAEWITAGLLFSFIQLAQYFYRPVLELAENFGVIQSALAGGERLFELLDTQEMIPDDGEPIPSDQRIKGQIDFKQVNFYYKKESPVLKEITFSIQPGEKVAIVGLTGSGKSTIANLITRLWDIQSGSIKIDGEDIRSFSLNSLRNQIITVQQDIFLFSGTIKDNICLGDCIDEEKLIAAAKTVNAHQFISKLPQGYDTEIMENGDNFSTGEKQLITFARAIAHNPAVVIMDEATSNVDTENEQLIQSAMKKLFKGRTSIVIAHRMSTIVDADRILVLSDGKVIEEGNHQQLMKSEGAYYHLCKLQFQN